MQADSIKIESEEDGFHMIVETPDLPRGRVNINIHSCAEALHEQVNLIIGGWLAEGQDAPTRPYTPEEKEMSARYWGQHPEQKARGEEPYDISNPKHPEFHSVHADLYDSREGK